jgi:hypothetical protein
MGWLAGMPGNLRIRRYCTGEVQLALTAPAQVSTVRDAVLKPASRRRQDSAAAVAELMAYLVSALAWGTRTGAAVAGAILNYSEKFAGGASDRYAWVLRRQSVKFGRYARIAVQETAWALEREYGKSAVLFTFTVPGRGPLVASAIADQSSFIVKRLRQWIRDVIGGPHGVVGVWENQRRGMLHLHICVASHNQEGLQELMDRRHEYWGKLLADVTKRTCINVCYCSPNMSRCITGGTTQQDADWIRKSIGRYLSKYVSKQARNKSNAAHLSPTRWWTVDRATHAMAKRYRVEKTMNGFRVEQWAEILKEVKEAAQGLWLSKVQYVNTYAIDLYGIVAWFEPGVDCNFLDVVDAIVEEKQRQGWHLWCHPPQSPLEVSYEKWCRFESVISGI